MFLMSLFGALFFMYPHQLYNCGSRRPAAVRARLPVVLQAGGGAGWRLVCLACDRHDMCTLVTVVHMMMSGSLVREGIMRALD